MHKFNEILEKLKDILSKELGNKKVSDKNVAAALGVNYDSFRHAKRRGSVPYYEIMQFLAKRNISINWFFFGQLPETLVDATSSYVLLKYNHTEYKAGIEHEKDMPQYSYIIVDKMFIDYLNIDHTNTEIIIVTGDSMQPTIKDDTIVFIDKNIHEPIEGIYAFESDGGLYVKRFEDIGIQYRIISDNITYGEHIVLKEEVTLIGKVAGQLGRV